MQTFLPSISFRQSAKWLDRPGRLGKQRVECIQILKALTDPGYGWQSHPAVTMWRGYEAALGRYGLIICEEWVRRGYKDTCYQKIVDLFDGIIPYQEAPPWLTEEFASNHRAILLGKAWETFLTVKAQKYELNKSYLDILNDKGKTKRRLEKARAQLNWYRQWDWAERPEWRNAEGKWPYLWPAISEVR